MSWCVVLTLREGTQSEYRYYAFVCQACGKHRGWPTRLQAERHLVDLNDSGVYSQLRAEHYDDGDDGTCPHGADATSAQRV